MYESIAMIFGLTTFILVALLPISLRLQKFYCKIMDLEDNPFETYTEDLNSFKDALIIATLYILYLAIAFIAVTLISTVWFIVVIILFFSIIFYFFKRSKSLKQ